MIDPDLTQLIYRFFHPLSLQPEHIDLQLQDQHHLTINLHPPSANKGIFIGHHATTLDSLQLILALIINQHQERHHLPRLSLTLDVDDYRRHRLDNLILKAEALAQQALRSGTPQPFPRLSPTERRQLHLYFKHHDAITTYSQGEGSQRQLFLAPKN